MLVGGAIVLLNGPDPEVPEPKYPKVILYHGLDDVGGDSVSMPPVFLGEKSETFLIIHNSGTDDLKVSGMSLSGDQASDFKLSRPDYFTLQPGEGKIIHMDYSPKATGTSDAQLSISTNDVNNTKMTVELTSSCEPIDRPNRLIAIAESGKVTLTWDPVDGAESYNLYWSLDPDLSASYVVPDVSSPYTLGGLTNGEKKYFEVTAVSEHGESEASDIIWAHPDTTYYINNVNGDDSQDGTSPETAWKTLERARIHGVSNP